MCLNRKRKRQKLQLKPVVNPSKERNINLQLDLEKSDRDSGTVMRSDNKMHHHVVHKQLQQQPSTEKAGNFYFSQGGFSFPSGNFLFSGIFFN